MGHQLSAISLQLSDKNSLKSNSEASLIADDSRKGFTLVELLVVIAIIAVLAAVAFVVYRDLAAQGRDGTRVADVTSLVQAITIAEHDEVDPSKALCFNTTAPCTGTSYPVGASTRNTDGTGWIPVNFDAKNIATFNNLPIDPINNGTYNYGYKSDGANFEVTAVLESLQYKNRMKDDGGNDDNLFEAGIGTKKI